MDQGKQERFDQWLSKEKLKAETNQEKFFLGIPESWGDKPHWFCSEGHASLNYLRAEEEGPLCLECFEVVKLGPPITEKEFQKALS